MGARGRRRWLLAGLVLCVLMLLAPARAPAATIVVDTTEDASPSVTNGNCSLREAITSVGSLGADDCEDGDDAAIDTIVFDDLTGPGPHLIAAARDFILNKQMNIDASGLGAEVRIDGEGATDPNDDHGIQPRADNIQIKGLSVTRWDQTGIKIDTNNDGSDAADGVQVIDSFIGTNRAGDANLGNASIGIQVGLPSVGPTREPDNTVIEGNVISGNGNGISVRGDQTLNTTIADNLIGTNPAGTAALANTGFGVDVADGADGATIGGATVGDGNVISGNGTQGVKLTAVGGDSTGTVTVRNNTIGLGATGAALGNGSAGVDVLGDVDGTTIQGNTISGNGTQGVALDDTAGAGPDNTTIRGNRIGTDLAGTSVVANAGAAVSLAAVNGEGTTGTSVGGDATGGGTCADPCNVIGGTGISLLHAEVTGTEVVGNHVGVDAFGTGPLATAGSGVLIVAGDDTVVGRPGDPNTIGSTAVAGIQMQAGVSGGTIQSNLIGTGSDGTGAVGNTNHGIELQDASGVLIGGTAAAEGNTIANNGADGVRVGFSGDDNPIVGNLIYDNGGLGIDLEDSGGFGPTPNDVGDADVGANDLQNNVALAVVAESSSVRLIGTLDSAPNTDFRIEVFTNPTPHQGGFGDGEELIDSFEVTTSGGSGTVTVDETVAGELPPSEELSLTVSELDGPGGNPVQTSEFTPPRESGFCIDAPASQSAAIVGSADADTLVGTAGADVICGLAGADVIDGGGGADLIIGGPGTDAIEMGSAPGPVQVDIGAGTAVGHGSDRIIGVEGAIGSAFADTLTGDGGPNTLDGAGGADAVDGGAGADALAGGPGNDALDAADGEADTSVDCGAGEDGAVADAPGVDPGPIFSGCEALDRPGPPELGIKAKRKQRDRKKVVVSATCEDEACDLAATGTIKVKVARGKKGTSRALVARSKKLKLKPASRSGVAAGATTKLKLKFNRKARKLVGKALKARRTSKAAVSVVATDGLGNASAPEKARIKVKK